jgi:hypothetical protein
LLLQAVVVVVDILQMAQMQMQLQLIRANQDGMGQPALLLTIRQVLEMVARYLIAAVAVAADFLEMEPQTLLVVATTHVVLEVPHL